jgi:hypothetical protein
MGPQVRVGARQRERQVGYDVQIQDVVSVHEHDLAALRSIEGIANPVARRLGDLSSSHDECVVDENTLVGLRIEDLVGKHHEGLVVDLGNVGIA